MIRKLSSLAFGAILALSTTTALAQGEEEDAISEDVGEEEGDGDGGGDAAASTSGAASTDAMPAGKGAFSKAGQIAISGDLQLQFESRSTKAAAGPDPDSQTTITIAPALDYFAIDGLSVGGQLGYSSTSQGDLSASAIIIGPRVGYNLGLTENISLWPRLAFQYRIVNLSRDNPPPATGTTDVSGNKMTVGVDAPILFHPAEHFFIGLGPYFEMDLSSKIEGDDADKDTAFGLKSVVGGWF